MPSTDAPVDADQPSAALFPDDHGELALESRRALVRLLSGPFIDRQRHPRLWAALVQDEANLRRRLSELFLELVVDVEGEVAFTRRADIGELEAPKLLKEMQLTFMDSVVLLLLRQQLMAAQTRGQRAVISFSEIVEAVGAYRPAHSSDEVGFVKRVAASVERLKKRNILQKVRADAERFEVSPTLRLLFDPEQVQALNAVYQTCLAGAPNADFSPFDDEHTGDVP